MKYKVVKETEVKLAKDTEFHERELSVTPAVLEDPTVLQPDVSQPATAVSFVPRADLIQKGIFFTGITVSPNMVAASYQTEPEIQITRLEKDTVIGKVRIIEIEEQKLILPGQTNIKT